MFTYRHSHDTLEPFTWCVVEDIVRKIGAHEQVSSGC